MRDASFNPHPTHESGATARTMEAGVAWVDTPVCADLFLYVSIDKTIFQFDVFSSCSPFYSSALVRFQSRLSYLLRLCANLVLEDSAQKVRADA